jgi:hypothetical protein
MTNIAGLRSEDLLHRDALDLLRLRLELHRLLFDFSLVQDRMLARQCSNSIAPGICGQACD